MTTITDPMIDRWYKDVENDLKFKVVAIDETTGEIEVQYFNGDIGEYDSDSWYNSTFDYIEAPEDWSAAYGDIETEDLGYTDTDLHNPSQDNIDLDDLIDS